MLAPAIVHEEELRARFQNRITDSDMRFYCFQSYVDYELTVDRNDWKRIQFVSVTRSSGVSAYFEARINRESLVVEDLLIASLRATGLPFEAAVDGFRFVAYLLEERGFRKVFFRFIRDNPFGPQYVRLVEELAGCGSVQGLLTEYVTLADGRAYDLVIVEIRKQPYLEWFHRRHALRTTA